ncbi:MAG: tRNA lysidine(34) synthetase TilS [Cytophagaceae bacterium SCN 52-12]|nr:MAG: tRNA lysidine(34) synthetase TilS [Cytophagaceae bacterium SCN 52-12]
MMLAEFLINFNKLVTGGDRDKVLLTVSGGIDSVVMCDLAGAAGLNCGVAHCNFRLRGEESDGDAAFVKELAARLGFRYHGIAFDTARVAEEQKISTQMAARNLRYDWFADLAEEFGYRHVATAHHAGDQVETVLLNLVRGTGIRGLRGIPAVNGRIIRPMLFATREQIEDYAGKRNLSWREDRSNSDDYYRRNRIRKHVVPVLKSINPSLEHTFSEMAERMEATEQWLSHTLKLWKNEVWQETGSLVRISIEGVKNAVSPVFQLLALLEDSGFSYQQVKEIVASLDGIPGKKFFSPTHLLVKDRDFLIMTGKEPPAEHTGVLKVELFPKPADFRPVPGEGAAFFDADLLKLPLSIRHWVAGDTFRPFGMGGRSKKVSDFLTDRKLDLISKSRIKVLVDADDNILWVIGLRGDHMTRVTEQTVNIARVSVSER